MKHAIKFYTFLNRNPDVPFPIKKQIAEACVFSSIVQRRGLLITSGKPSPYTPRS